jgi:hypothetical protein
MSGSSWLLRGRPQQPELYFGLEHLQELDGSLAFRGTEGNG